MELFHYRVKMKACRSFWFIFITKNLVTLAFISIHSASTSLRSASDSASDSITVVPAGAVAMAATENRALGSRPSLGLNNEFEDAWRDMTRDDRPPRDEDVPEPAEDVSVSHFLLRFGCSFFDSALLEAVAASKYVNVSLTSDRADAPFLFIWGLWG